MCSAADDPTQHDAMSIDVEALQTKGREVAAGHRERADRCRECGMLWPCHAVLLAWDIARLVPAEDEGRACPRCWDFGAANARSRAQR